LSLVIIVAFNSGAYQRSGGHKDGLFISIFPAGMVEP